ncbi:MAG: DUF1501 domain-containing protein, partial [Planctomyces sp.]
MLQSTCQSDQHQFSRRRWLGTAAAGAAAVALPVFDPAVHAAALQRSSTQVLFNWLEGGLRQLECWDPKPNPDFGGPFRAIPT